MLTEALVEDIREYLKDTPAGSEIFIGCDSSRYKGPQATWYASYTTAVCVARVDETGRRSGARVFFETERKQDYDQRKDRPMMRMMQEAYFSVEAYQQLEEEFLDHEVEIHLDVNDDPKHGSNCARGAAVGIAMQTGRPVRTKPEAWAATHVADHGVRGKFRHVGQRLH